MSLAHDLMQLKMENQLENLKASTPYSTSTNRCTVAVVVGLQSR